MVDIEMDLASVLQTATEEKITLNLPNSTTAEPEAQTDETELDFSDDFDQETLKTETESENAFTETENKINDALFDNSQLAPAIVDGLDLIQRSLFPKAYISMLTKEDRVAMKSLIQQYRTSKNKTQMLLDENGQRIMEIMCDYEEYKESLPFSKEEKKSLIVPLREVLKKINLQPSPESALLTAAIITMLPRVTPLAIKYTGVFDDTKNENE